MRRRYVKPTPLPDLPEHFISDPAQLPACLEHLAAAPVLGFDTEFVGEDAYRPELCLVQVSTAEQLFVIDPFGVGPLDEFWALLLDPKRKTVLHAGREDVRMCFFKAGKPPADVFDVQIAAGLVGMTYPIGYAGLVSDVLGQRMTKGETLTDWRRRPLHPAQVRYAFDDVRFLLPAWKKLTDKLKRLKRLDWATEEFATSVRRAVGDEEAAAEKWRKVKGIGGLDRRGLAVAREVFGWREQFAERVNRPPRQLLRDDILAEIAKRGPTRTEDLSAYRGMPQKETERILEAVRRARELPLEDCPEPELRDNDPPHVTLLGSLLGVVLNDWCTRNKLAANLVASGSDLRAVVRSRVFGEPVPDVPLTRGWRETAVLSELQRILNGETAIRVENPRAAAPLGFLAVAPDPPDVVEPESKLPLPSAPPDPV
ncbi:ribonuclease d : Ribonuclease D OS=Planctomyces limnophilus (strain ATCC 43296 / DSM 3776 / IFAM 1008 / 290) GN=Plim_0672 PE=4 SV=1: DNA_pol_A_exo1: HRDC [Gemmataceae bacterium]|nr:ribonuclease d : Ribonuclease D OS=Planctomyces limnophilus (strain ATCC 43296 / DSM 3776 / IFAM 1008 / 290) GN=Plim_0672 PE=4 SV=1: DNA_pol_A_exo1: HRDC [Gemmataceae bacterium]VTT98525.1 ribonuclease d : Ribonuclease D OS=Planctomyces limnophilus (strain ATCC 43296 / DSM 3776 / IFAM 1008 / 290) GN=Plim_0672 PE=4 SV=1: DNA_pol_A_exo1: HRDC [Gemmataceae bacterium]